MPENFGEIRGNEGNLNDAGNSSKNLAHIAEKLNFLAAPMVHELSSEFMTETNKEVWVFILRTADRIFAILFLMINSVALTFLVPYYISD